MQRKYNHDCTTIHDIWESLAKSLKSSSKAKKVGGESVAKSCEGVIICLILWDTLASSDTQLCRKRAIASPSWNWKLRLLWNFGAICMTIFLPLSSRVSARSCAARQLCRRRRSAKCQTAPNSLTPVRRHVKFRREIKRMSINMMKHNVVGKTQCSYDRESHHNRKTGYFEILEHEGDRWGGANWMPLLSTIFYGRMTREHQKVYSGS